MKSLSSCSLRLYNICLVLVYFSGDYYPANYFVILTILLCNFIQHKWKTLRAPNIFSHSTLNIISIHICLFAQNCCCYCWLKCRVFRPSSCSVWKFYSSVKLFCIHLHFNLSFVWYCWKQSAIELTFLLCKNRIEIWIVECDEMIVHMAIFYVHYIYGCV